MVARAGVQVAGVHVEVGRERQARQRVHPVCCATRRTRVVRLWCSRRRELRGRSRNENTRIFRVRGVAMLRDACRQHAADRIGFPQRH